MRIVPKLGCLALLGLLTVSFARAQSPQAAVDRIVELPEFKSAAKSIESDHDRFVREIILLTEIPAPPFKETARARVFMQMLKDSGLANVEIDAVGNVIGLRKGTGNGPLVAIAAHLDTVFPEGTDVKVRRQGTRLMAPGVGDDTQALAEVLSIIRAMDHAGIQTTSDILFIGDVGEEGPGDLRGMRYLFQEGPYKNRIKLFVSIDGPGSGNDMVTGALGSRRYRVSFRGPGGHSYGAFGLVNPAYAMAKAMDKISRMQVTANPRTTYNVGVIGGGTSVNSIPNEVWMEVDLRSESPRELERLSDNFLKLMHAAGDEENLTRSTVQGKIVVEPKLIGDRPSGKTSVDSVLVQTASAVIRRLGKQPGYGIGSTDANIPISMNIPAITIDAGGSGGRAHAPDEWIDIEKTASVEGIQQVMATILCLAGVQ